MSIYMTGTSSPEIREAAENDLYGRLGLLVTPDTYYLRTHVPSFQAWGMDNACFANGGEFDGDTFLRQLDWIINHVDHAHERCHFAVAPDMFDAVNMIGDWRGTIDRSWSWLPRIRDAGAPAALVYQDGLQHHIDQIPWDAFDVAFIGGSDAFKLGYPRLVPKFPDRDAGNPHYAVLPCLGAIDQDTRKWAELIAETLLRGKEIHVGRVNSRTRLAFCEEIGAATCDGTFITRGGLKNLNRIRNWFNTLEGSHAT